MNHANAEDAIIANCCRYIAVETAWSCFTDINSRSFINRQTRVEEEFVPAQQLGTAAAYCRLVVASASCHMTCSVAQSDCLSYSTYVVLHLTAVYHTGHYLRNISKRGLNIDCGR